MLERNPAPSWAEVGVHGVDLWCRVSNLMNLQLDETEETVNIEISW